MGNWCGKDNSNQDTLTQAIFGGEVMTDGTSEGRGSNTGNPGKFESTKY